MNEERHMKLGALSQLLRHLTYLDAASVL